MGLKRIDLYFWIKPIVPRRLQILLRRAIAFHKRKANAAIWPINAAASRSPAGWTGWPNQKDFALILSHDVDTSAGYNKCMRLKEIEERLGFRSSFNFVPEGYQIGKSLRSELVKTGFEVGVHGLKHDAQLFRKREIFNRRAVQINRYLKEWGAVGFHSPSMYHNLEWIVDLDIEYDNSTFDTDPFEPQPDGLNTIFPLWIINRARTRGYVELPYTLPQDHCLFVILKEKNIQIWKKKLDWIAQHGGMALLNTHPDYMNFDGNRCSLEEYPVAYYIDFLEYAANRYAGRYWHALPRDVARFWKKSIPEGDRIDTIENNSLKPVPQKKHSIENPTSPASGTHIWVDLDNTPHVPFFIPIIRELERRGHKVTLTARDAFQVCELADKMGLHYTKAGRHYGKNMARKVFGLLWRSLQLTPFLLRQRPRLALSHGSRSQILLSNLFRIPTILVMDYEYAQTIPFAHPRWMIVPMALAGKKLYSKEEYVRYYRGIKEDVYAPEFKPDPTLLKDLGLGQDEIVVTVRPPANEAHYYTPESDRLMLELMSRIRQTPGIRVVLLPRNQAQGRDLKARHPEWFLNDKTIIPSRVVGGLDLLWFSDLVVSGGGTMNREAAALGVPVYSIFRGKSGAVDLMLEKEGRLTMIHDVEEVWTKIRFIHRDKTGGPNNRPRAALEDIVNHIEEIIRIDCARPISQKAVGSSCVRENK